MTRDFIKGKLKQSNSGSDAYSRGIKDANRIAKIWINKTFDHFEKENEKDEPQEHKNQAVINFCDENEEILKDLG